MRDLKTYWKDASNKIDAVDGVGASLAAGNIYYAELCDLDGDGAPLTAITWSWDANFAGSIVVVATNQPEKRTYDAGVSPFIGTGFKQVTDIDVVTVVTGTADSYNDSWTDQGHGRLVAVIACTHDGVLRGSINHKRARR